MSITFEKDGYTVNKKGEMVLAVGRVLNEFLNKLASKVFYEDEVLQPSGDNLIEAVEQAHKEWMQAQKYFQMVSDPDLVDHAIYLAQAAQKRYTYLLKEARKEGVRLNLRESR